MNGPRPRQADRQDPVAAHRPPQPISPKPRAFLCSEEAPATSPASSSTSTAASPSAPRSAEVLTLRRDDGCTWTAQIRLGGFVRGAVHDRDPVAGHVVEGPWSKALSEAARQSRLLRALDGSAFDVHPRPSSARLQWPSCNGAHAWAWTAGAFGCSSSCTRTSHTSRTPGPAGGSRSARPSSWSGARSPDAPPSRATQITASATHRSLGRDRLDFSQPEREPVTETPKRAGEWGSRFGDDAAYH